jgi:hypothetical protein
MAWVIDFSEFFVSNFRNLQYGFQSSRAEGERETVNNTVVWGYQREVMSGA